MTEDGAAKAIKNSAGLYIHVPFCLCKCQYCDFNSDTNLSLIPVYINALFREMRLLADVPLCFDTIYLGGGTPSVLKPTQIRRIFTALYTIFRIDPNPEVTIEVNPKTADPGAFELYRSAGINRINLGVQSFSDDNLRFLGRIHSWKDAVFGIVQAQRAGFENIGLDLIYGLPGQSRDGWMDDLKRAVDHRPAHLSCYMLTYEPGTPMDEKRRKGIITPMPDEKAVELFDLTIAFLEDQGYDQYEISNYACSPETRSQHNLKYWNFMPYLGIGPGAHSYLHPFRSWNYPNLSDYVERLSKWQVPSEGKEKPDQEQRMIEAIYLGLRKREGIDIPQFEGMFDLDFRKIFGKTLKELENEGMVRTGRGRCRLTRYGMRFLDSVASRLCAAF